MLDVGCGFGGTLDHIRGRNRGCRLVGVNIDLRQLQWARRVLGGNDAGHEPISLATGDGCRLPVRAGSQDHVLAVECVFHFPSRRAFFREAARVLEPGGTLALSDFVIADGAVGAVSSDVASLGLGEWFGRSAAPLTPAGYERLGRACGFEVLSSTTTSRPDAADLPGAAPALPRVGLDRRGRHHRRRGGAGPGGRLAVPRAGLPATGGAAMTGMAYVDSALAHMEEGGPPPFWRHFHWGLFPDPERADDSPERYFAAAEAMTDRIIAAGEVGDGARVLDVGCGFGGTLDHLRSRAPAAPWRGSTSTSASCAGPGGCWRRRPGWRRRSWPPTAAGCRWPPGRWTTCWRWSACSTSPAGGRSSGRRPGCCAPGARWRCRTS